MHLGHARTFWTAQARTEERGGILVLRNEDLDDDRCRAHFAAAMMEDLAWFGFRWAEGPDCGGPFGPYCQSQRRARYAEAWSQLRAQGVIYPCRCSRRDIAEALGAPHAGQEEPIYPGTCRPAPDAPLEAAALENRAQRMNWRFRVPEGEKVTFIDRSLGPQEFVAGRDFGDFVVWRHDGLPSYQLAVVVDDAAMGMTEVVRGCDLLVSTARQLLLYRAFGWEAPDFFHCALMRDAQGARLAKRHDALSLRALRAQGFTPDALRREWAKGG